MSYSSKRFWSLVCIFIVFDTLKHYWHQHPQRFMRLEHYLVFERFVRNADRRLFPDLIETKMNSSSYCGNPYLVAYSSDKREFTGRINQALTNFGINNLGDECKLLNTAHNVSNYSDKFKGNLQFLEKASEHKRLLTKLYLNSI